MFPAGKKRRGKFLIGDILGSPGDSLEVVLEGEKAGLWTDRATGDGGDIFALIAAYLEANIHTDFPRVLDEAADLLGRSRSVPVRKAKMEAPVDDLGPATAKWDYFDATGKLIAVVYRYDPPGRKKEFRPWDAKRRKMAPPDPRPLYNQPGLAAAGHVVLVEGEKCAQALIAIGVAATTAMHGANAPVDKTDWSPLAGKSVLIWPDRDAPGWDYADRASQAILNAGATTVAILVPPDDKPDGWDAADAIPEGFDVGGFLAVGERMPVMRSVEETPPPDLLTGVDWTTEDGLSSTFTRRYGEDWRYCALWGKWLVWTGVRWNPDQVLYVSHLSRGICRMPYARNARTHSDDQVAQIAASIAEFGFTNPILAGSDGIIVAGHGRLAAAQRLGLEIVPVVVLDHLSPTQRRALVIADNRIAENAGWDDAMLRIELESLQLEGFDIDLTGFDADALAELLAGDEPNNDGQTDEDAVPEVGETPISRSGDVWIMGPHRLLCGDSTVADSYGRLMQGEVADMVFTDPPYNVNYANSAKDKMRGKDRAILNDNLGDGFYDFLLAALTPTVVHCRGGIYVAMSSSELDVLQAAFRAAGGKWSTFVIWAKNTFTLGRADYQRQYEPILYGWPEGAQRHWCGDRDQGDVWNIKKPQKNDLHPTMKPVELVERAIRNSSRPGNVVLDPFGGSGTTLIAAEKSGRAARLIELDPKYVDVIVRRWEDFTGQTAIREAADQEVCAS